MDTFQLNILSASSAFYEGECESLVVPTPDGKCGVLAHHSNAIAAISPGELSYTVPGEKPRLAAVSHGMIKIEDNHVLVLVETAEKPEDIDRKAFESELYTAGLPDVDFLIRTSGEMRLSNFLLYQLAYAEFYQTDTLWPDFDRHAYDEALLAYAKRNRRFGGV